MTTAASDCNFSVEQQERLFKAAATLVHSRISFHFKQDFTPKILIICGSGLGGISNKLSSEPAPLKIPYGEIPGFKKSTVAGHAGELILGFMNETPVALMNGRLHGYEGHTLAETTFPIRAMNAMGCFKYLIVTNAAGGLNPDYNECDLMCIVDHISLPGLVGSNALRGPNFDSTGPRFLATSDAYDLDIRKLLFNKHKELKLERKLHEGTYIHLSGPTYESRAESRFVRMIGADAVGMSTVPEVVVARHCGWKVLALSLITNKCVLDPPPSVFDENPVSVYEGKATHAEVLENSLKASADVEALIHEVVRPLGSSSF